MSDLAAASAALTAWCVHAALPFWAQQGMDPRGGSFEAMTPGGAPLRERAKRFRVHPRQAYVYAHATLLGLKDAAAAKAASDHAFAFALGPGTQGRPPAADRPFSGFVHLLSPEGEAVDAGRDIYDHAFVLLACAYRYSAFGDETALVAADRTLSFLDTLRCPDGSYLEGAPARLPRRQNPHMHLFEAFMALARATGQARWREHGAEMHALFGRHFWDGAVLREFFAADWSLDQEKGNIVEPGHMAEWCWLLDMWQDLSGEEEGGAIRALFGAAEATGLDPKSGFLIDEAFADGRPSRRTRRLWVQCEYAKACLVLARRGDIHAGNKAARLIEAIMASYLRDGGDGLWNDQYDEAGRVISEDVPASTLYHLVSLAAEAARAARAA